MFVYLLITGGVEGRGRPWRYLLVAIIALLQRLRRNTSAVVLLTMSANSIESLGGGGEEFVMLLPQTRLADARSVAEELRHAVIDIGLRACGGAGSRANDEDQGTKIQDTTSALDKKTNEKQCFEQIVSKCRNLSWTKIAQLPMFCLEGHRQPLEKSAAPGTKPVLLINRTNVPKRGN